MNEKIPNNNILKSGILPLTIGLAIGLIGLMFSDLRLSIVVLIGLIFVLVIALNPEVGIILLVFTTYIRLSDVLIHEHGMPSIAKVFIPFMLSIILIRWNVLNEKLIGWETSIILLVVYGLIIFASQLYTTDILRTHSGFVEYIKDACLCTIIILQIRTGETLRRVVWALIIAGVFMGTITVTQKLTGNYDFNYWGYGQSKIMHIIGESSDHRVSGQIPPNSYAQILIAIVPIAIDRFWKEKSGVLRMIAAWALIVCILSIIFTYSRGGFIALTAALGFMFVGRKIHPAAPIILLISLFSIWHFAAEDYKQRIATLTDFIGGNAVEETSYRGRLSEIIVASNMFLEHPFFGVGYEDFETHYHRFARKLALDSRQERAAHCLYLEVAAETGLLGISVFGIILVFMFKGMRDTHKKCAKNNQLMEYSSIIKALTAGIIGYLTAAVFLHMIYSRLFWLLISIGLAVPNIATYQFRKKD